MFLSDLCLCAKAFASYADGANGRVSVFVSSELLTVSVTRHACVCLRVFVG